MITLTQIKAARALLNWTQEKLATASRLSLPGINNLERGLTSPRKETLSSIQTALQAAGIEFIDTSGVRLRTPDLSIETIEGPDWLGVYDRDIFSVLQKPGDEIVQMSCDERLWMIHGSATNPHYVEHREKTGFKERLIVPDTVDFITSPPAAYRTLDPAYFGHINYQVYGNRLSLIMWESRKIILIKSQSLADAFRAQFELLWISGKPFTPAQLKKLEMWDGNSVKKK